MIKPEQGGFRIHINGAVWLANFFLVILLGKIAKIAKNKAKYTDSAAESRNLHYK